MDLRFAPEIERALVGLLWHEPELLAEVLREIDPATHIFEPANRILLEAITALYRHQGATDWATVVNYLRQIEQIDELGGVQNLDAIYCRPGYRSLVSYYVELLKEYAAIRDPEPARPAYFFSVGRGVLWPNKRKNNSKAPDMVGSSNVAGRFYSLSAWKAEAPDGSTQLRLRFEFNPEPKNGRLPDTKRVFQGSTARIRDS